MEWNAAIGGRGGWRSLLACVAWMGALQMHLSMSVWNKNASRNKGAKPTRGKVINIGSGKETSILTVVKLIMNLLNCDKEIKLGV